MFLSFKLQYDLKMSLVNRAKYQASIDEFFEHTSEGILYRGMSVIGRSVLIYL
jgi:hypothetical protein